MIPLHYFIFLFFIQIIHSSVIFKMNPGCDLDQCKKSGYPAIFYGNQFVGDDTIHILYSSFDELTISIIQTKKGHGPQINYTALFNKDYTNSISFGDTYPLNIFSLII